MKICFIICLKEYCLNYKTKQNNTKSYHLESEGEKKIMILTAHDDYSIYSQHNNIEVKSVDLIEMQLFFPPEETV